MMIGRKPNVVRGDFVTDGETFIFRLEGTPLSGVGRSASAAFDDLIRVQDETQPLTARLKELERDQQDEGVRATIVRMSMVGLIVFGVVGGALFGTAALLPRVIADTSETVMTKTASWLEDMPVEKQQRLSAAIVRLRSQFEGPKQIAPTDANR
jgi:hypothetical protein